MRVLVVEDETRMARMLERGLVEAGHRVELTADGEEALAALACSEFDVIVLDIMLPGIDGWEVARRLRQRGSVVPILFLTARDSVPDVVKGLDTGGDDYLTKPFAFDVLLARLRAIVRRRAHSGSPTLSVGDLTLSPASREVRRGKRLLSLTKTEFALLEALMLRARRVVAREALIEMVWGNESEASGSRLDVLVSLLRQKVEEETGPRLIHTVRGVGYVLRDHREDLTP